MRPISRKMMADHYDREALAKCRALLVDGDLAFVVARARRFDSLIAKRVAASKYVLHLGFACAESERDIDHLVAEIFDHPIPRPEAWGRVPSDETTRRGGGLTLLER